MKERPLTPREAEWLCCLIEAFTTTQERRSDERLRQGVWGKLRAIANRRRSR